MWDYIQVQRKKVVCAVVSTIPFYGPESRSGESKRPVISEHSGSPLAKPLPSINR